MRNVLIRSRIVKIMIILCLSNQCRWKTSNLLSVWELKSTLNILINRLFSFLIERLVFFCCIKSSLKQVQLLIFVLKELHIFLQIIFSHLLFLMLCIADLIGFDISSLFFWIKTGLYCGFIRGISNRSLIVLIWINGLIIILIFCLIRILVVPEKFFINIIFYPIPNYISCGSNNFFSIIYKITPSISCM
jgi:hypothetical protein